VTGLSAAPYTACQHPATEENGHDRPHRRLLQLQALDDALLRLEDGSLNPPTAQ